MQQQQALVSAVSITVLVLLWKHLPCSLSYCWHLHVFPWDFLHLLIFPPQSSSCLVQSIKMFSVFACASSWCSGASLLCHHGPGCKVCLIKKGLFMNAGYRNTDGHLNQSQWFNIKCKAVFKRCSELPLIKNLTHRHSTNTGFKKILALLCLVYYSSQEYWIFVFTLAYSVFIQDTNTML